jgi:hypothetical protein
LLIGLHRFLNFANFESEGANIDQKLRRDYFIC